MLIAVILSYLIWILCMVFTGILATNKKRSLLGWMVLTLFFGPVALLLIALLPKINPGGTQHTDSTASLHNIKEELQETKTKFYALKNRIDSLETKISMLLESKQITDHDYEVSKEEISKTKANAEIITNKSSDIEVNIGRFWLNKIGIVVFALGMGFLISYTFKYFGALAKILFGYLVSSALFFFGLKLEKKSRFINYGRVLLGGAWAITYLTTYAMYHFDASRIINNQLLDLLFLAIVTIGIISHALKYKSQELSAMALFIGYFTSTLGNISYFTNLSSLLLAAAALVLVYKMQWIRILFVGIIFTYLTHIFWVIKQIYLSRVPVGYLNVNQVYFLMHIGFLFVYWSLFTAGIHIIKERSNYDRLSAANFSNFILFFFLAYSKLSRIYPEYKFGFIFGLGVVYLFMAFIMDRIKKDKLFTSNTLIAISLLTLSVPLKFMRFHTTVIWLIELPFLVLVGLNFNRKIFRYFSFCLASFLFFKILIIDFSVKETICIWGYILDWHKFISFLVFFLWDFVFILVNIRRSSKP